MGYIIIVIYMWKCLCVIYVHNTSNMMKCVFMIFNPYFSKVWIASRSSEITTLTFRIDKEKILTFVSYLCVENKIIGDFVTEMF